jgi:ABC-type multidrug transport system, ATPase and permease components
MKIIFKSVLLWIEIILHGKLWSLLMFFITVLEGLIPAAQIFIFGKITSLFLNLSQNWIELLIYIAIYLSCSLITNVVPKLSEYISFMIKNETDIYTSEKLFSKILSLDYRYREESECIQLVSHSDNALNPYRITLILQDTCKLVSYIINLISIFIILVSINVIISILYLIFVGVSVVIMTKSMKSHTDFFMNQFAKDRIANQYKSNLYDINKVIEFKIYNAFDYMYNKWENYRTELNKVNMKYSMKQNVGYLASMFINQEPFMIISLLIYFLTGGASIQQASQIFESIRKMGGIANQLSIIIGTRATDLQYYKSYYLLQEKNSQVYPQFEVDNTSDDIIIKDLNFKYSENGFGLNNINMQIKKGTRVAIVGYNGSGKTTLTKLLLNLYKPDSGTISFSNSSNINYASVFQDYMIYNLTIRENIGFGSIDDMYNDEKILNVARQADIVQLIDKNGIDGTVGMEYGGVQFSGGESQRLALARAYMNTQSDLAVFDEPTSAIDALEESEFLKKIIEYTNDKTSVIVTHRLSTTTTADYVYVMDNGAIVEEGTHNELMERHGLYFDMFTVQAENYIV